MNLLTVGGGKCLYQLCDLLVAQRFGISNESDGSREALQIPREWTNICLVEVIDIKD